MISSDQAESALAARCSVSSLARGDRGSPKSTEKTTNPGELTPAQQARMGRSRPVNPEAQLAYWKARYFLNALRDPEATRKGIEYSEQAVRLEPAYAAAHAALAMAYAMLSGGSTIPPDAVNRARSAARMAIDLDDKLSDAHVGLGSVLLLYDWDWAGAEREFKHAIDLNPSNAEAHQWLSSYWAAVGRLDEAVAAGRRARELDPLSFRTNWSLGRILCFARNQPPKGFRTSPRTAHQFSAAQSRMATNRPQPLIRVHSRKFAACQDTRPLYARAASAAPAASF